MKASKVTHRNELRIRVDFPYNASLALKIKEITDVRWSKTLRAWHIPYTSEAFMQLRTLFPEIEIVTQNSDTKTDKILAQENTSIISKAVSIEISSNDDIVRTEHLVEKVTSHEVTHPNVANRKKLILHNTVKSQDISMPEVEILVTPMHLDIKIAKNETNKFTQYNRG